MEHIITAESIYAFSQYLRSAEKSRGTIANYTRHLHRFAAYTKEEPVTRELTCLWKSCLAEQGYRSASINAMLVSVNSYLKWCGAVECCVKTLRIQKRFFRDRDRELKASDYEKLVNAAKRQGKERLALLMETIAATGIRVGELQYITREAARGGFAEVKLKGKVRTILIPRKLCEKLLNYAKKKKIVSGEIFVTRNGKSIDRRQVWSEIKGLCKCAGVAGKKVFPHNFRHLFATTFYKAHKDIARLADILGHSSMETTRIYLLTSGAEHLRQMEKLGLIL